MNIILLTASPIYKTSGELAINLMEVFNKSGYRSVILTPYCNDKKLENVVEINHRILCFKNKLVRAFNRTINKHIYKIDSNYYFQDYDITKSNHYYRKIVKELPFKPDVFIYLFPQYFLNMNDLYKLNQITGAPILWYMMDMFPITGGCHYAWDCKGYENSCGNCPGLYSKSLNDQSYFNWNYKKEYIDKTNIVPIAASEWQFRQLRESKLFINKNKYKILISIDPEIFKPKNKVNIRKNLKIPINKQIIFFGSVNVLEKRKGLEELINALKILKKLYGAERSKQLHLIIAGNNLKEFDGILPFSFSFLGYLSQKQLSKAFQVADIFVCPSIEDSGPMMINQSIMCGTPVVAFEMGVAPDLVITGKTGYRAKLKDSEDLANGIDYVLNLNDSEYKKMSINCRKLGLKLLHPQKQLKQFVELIEDLRRGKNEN